MRGLHLLPTEVPSANVKPMVCQSGTCDYSRRMMAVVISFCVDGRIQVIGNQVTLLALSCNVTLTLVPEVMVAKFNVLPFSSVT